MDGDDDHQLVFPGVLRRLAYANRIGPADRREVRISITDALALLGRYCREMYLGVQYDVRITEAWNHNNPDCLVLENLAVARLVHAQGFSNADLADLLDVPIPSLAAIPLDANLLETDVYDRPAAVALAMLDRYRGLNAANASKILHQKRPGMFPIFDELMRRAIGLPWVDGEDAEAYRSLLARYRAFLATSTNRGAFIVLMSRIGEQGPEHLRGRSQVRVLDALAWSLIIYQDPFG